MAIHEDLLRRCWPARSSTGSGLWTSCATRFAAGKPEAIHLDNGPELTAEASVEWAARHGVKLLSTQPGMPNQNGLIERFNRSFRQEVLDARLFNAVGEVQTAADDWLADDNECRLHESLNSVPPA